jgi:hypothetical protein
MHSMHSDNINNDTNLDDNTDKEIYNKSFTLGYEDGLKVSQSKSFQNGFSKGVKV